jgi:hypothetical protein
MSWTDLYHVDLVLLCAALVVYLVRVIVALR